jgi:hypothetical protein
MEFSLLILIRDGRRVAAPDIPNAATQCLPWGKSMSVHDSGWNDGYFTRQKFRPRF